uniref:Large ribosomal subunit protein uL5c n=1 Tax=Calliarthron tuberculosum TaxID=48942 RepID=M4IU55_CALTB|nr:50S ribosomal protein L5 [Calliarthron tuberculosum]AGA63828.1 50S ribosomal protein L5 [Calliarthron tuberculosum]
MTESLQKLYNNQIKNNLQNTFRYENIHEIPKITKIVLNRGLGEASQNSKTLESSMQELMLISGQKPIITRSKKSIAGFKIREDIPIGMTVTLRKQKMYNFLNKLINLALPRIRDFRGISKNHFDGKGNYNLGLREQLIFPEIEYDTVDKIRGMDIAIVTTAKTDIEGLSLLQGFGMPFRN